MKKLWIITDICHLELCDPNRFHFASVSTSRLWELSSWSCGLNFQCVYHLCIIKVGQMQQRLCTCISKTEPQPSVQGKMSVPRLFAGQLSSGIVSRKVCFCNIAISPPICGFPVAWINFKCSLLTVQKKKHRLHFLGLTCISLNSQKTLILPCKNEEQQMLLHCTPNTQAHRHRNPNCYMA